MKNLHFQAPISSDAICRKWPLYESMVRNRLLAGAIEYGDSSFSKSLDKLLEELAEELMDVTGWAFILWCKVQSMQQELQIRKEDKDDR